MLGILAFLLLSFVGLAVFEEPATLEDDLNVIKQRMIISFLPIDEHGGEEIARQANGYAETLNADNSWPDIDYKDESRGAWKASQHLSRVKVMCTAFRSPKSSLHNSTKLSSVIHRALDFWLVHDFKNPNWWYNEIGVPLDIANSYLLFEAELTKNETEKGVEIMERATWWKGWTGANLVWMCNIQIQRGLLTGNETAVDQCFDRIYKEIFVGHQQQDGIQTDGSFHQHGPELLAGSYGSIFTSQILVYIGYSQGTKYFMSNNTLSNFSHLVLDGQQWMIYGGTWDWSVSGRGCANPHDGGEALSPAELQQVPGPRHQEYVSFANRITNKFDPPLLGNSYYWDSDYMVHRKPGYMVSLHMHSNRTIPARCVNSQGIKSEHFADGVVNIYYTGREYDDIFPVWDWQRLPGITCEQNIPLLPCNYDFHVKSSNFVGGVSDSTRGGAAMHLVSHDLSALKSWFLFDDLYVAMGTNISCLSGNPIFTSLANRLLDGNVTVKMSRGSPPMTLMAGNHTFPLSSAMTDSQLLWVHHGNTGYIPFNDYQWSLDGQAMLHSGRLDVGVPFMHVNNVPRTGDWSSIGTSHGNITRDVFDMYIDHHLSSGTAFPYAYAVVPLVHASQMDSLLQSHANIKILSNTPSVQAVFHMKEKTLTAVVWQSNGGKINGGEGWQIQVNFAVLLIVSEEVNSPGKVKLSVSSPIYPPHQGVTIQIDRSLKCNEPAAWQRMETGDFEMTTSVNVLLPTGDGWGKSVMVECRTVRGDQEQ